ncbi:DNA-binding transcriptional regulator, GntR family [Dethiosulfatibacter aminovorans DSM 17477]|uniref:DNA-binding transcriptional regulator, GntR family n=1 Tax=Dethiosulfatibacter aminovorans DSM 17477 TaxID=1121476 RepID=A0A1M6B1N3_9FIRM|nr:GntR family transcriptional regulator [Dethiosulfatibacter aminovorans]SHI42616.1 DNA-binding transcriptional regulator, GntR family [Dethiosulfatibacter aminovorans DSM 17477]
MDTTLPLRDQAIKYILDKIQHNELKVDEIFTEQQICDEMGISRTPVREALIQLTSDNIISRIPRKGYTIVELEDAAKMNLYTIIATLDALAASLAVEYMTDEDFLKMEELCDKIDIAIKYKNFSDYYSLQDEFHRIYLNKCSNPKLVELVETLESGPVHRSYISDDKERLFKALEESNAEHRTIIEMFKNKKTQELESFLRNVHWATKYPDMI